MKSIRKPSHKVTAVLLAIIVVAGGIPFVTGTHINDMLTPWREVPETDTLLDAAIETAGSVLNGVADDERIKPLREEPQIPATFFHDIFNPNDRIGGWGEWEPDQTIALPDDGELGAWTDDERWHLHPSAAGRDVQVPWVTPAGNVELQSRGYDIDQGYRFGDGVGYPVPDETDDDLGLSFSILVSPVISLRSLPVQAPDEREDLPQSGAIDQVAGVDEEGAVDLARQAADARPPMSGHFDHQDRVILYMDHKYHLANPDDSGSIPRAGDRVGVFLLDEDGNVISGDDYLQPLRGPSFTHNGFSGSFMGSQFNFTEEAFDVSPWAGQDVRIAFEVGTEGLDGLNPNEHFDNRFDDPDADFFGWAVSNVRVEGPAHMHNVRLDRVTYPAAQGPDGRFMAATGTQALEVLVLNKGRVSEDVVVRMDVDGLEIGVCENEVEITLRPGEAVEVDFVQDRSVPPEQRLGCLDVHDGDEFSVLFEVELLGDDEDMYPSDNQLGSRVQGQGPDLRSDGRMIADPALERANTPVTLTLPVVNLGASDADADFTLRIDRQHPNETDFNEEDVHLDDSLLRFSSNIDQRVTIEAREEQIVSWGFMIQEAGLYRVSVDVTGVGGHEFFTATTIVGVLMAPEFAYDTRFDGTEFDDDTKIRGAWEAQSALGTLPPCQDLANRAACLLEDEMKVWELESNREAIDWENVAFGGTSVPPLHTALRGEIEPEQWVQNPVAAEALVSEIEIQVLHYAEDIRCPQTERASSAQRACDVPLGGFGTWRSQIPAPDNRLSIRLVEGAVSVGETTISNIGLVPRPTEVQSLELQHLGGSHYRNAYFSGQWLTETYRVSATDLFGVDSVPATRFSDVALEFVLSVNHHLSECLTSAGKDTSCPTWRIAEASMRAIPDEGGDPIEMLHWTGLRNEEIQGDWFSYAYTHSASGFAITVNHPSSESSYPSCPDAEANSEAIEENRFYCPIWKQRPVSEFLSAVEPDATWSRYPEGFWTGSSEQADRTFRYEEQAGHGMVDLLLSPVLRIPDGEAPRVMFEHRFQLHPYTEQGLDWTDLPSWSDTGMVMVRFFDPSGEDSMTPYLPVYLDGGRFMRHDCENYYSSSHPDLDAGCPDALLGRSPVVEGFDLTEFPILDYRDVTTGDRGGDGGYGINADGIPTEAGDVRAAFTPMDLRRCTAQGLPVPVGKEVPEGAGPCAVQFGFRMEIPDPRPASSGWDIEEAKNTARQSALGPEKSDAEGWFIDSFRIAKDDLVDFDLQLTDAWIDTDYPWEELGFGPGTKATATLEVRNNGFFTVNDAAFHVMIQDSVSLKTWKVEVPSDPEFVLAEGEATTVEMEFDLPNQDGNYRFVFGVDLQGDRIPDEIPLVDMGPGNDCLYLQLDGRQRTQSLDRSVEAGGIPGDCRIGQAGTVSVTSNPILGMELSVSPESGRTGEEFPREINLRINNTGNVVVEDARIDIMIQRSAVDAEAPQNFHWIVSESPLPGHSRSWTGLPMADPATGETSPPIARIVLEKTGTYFVTAFLRPSPIDEAKGSDWDVARQLRLDAFDSIYSDTFAPRGVDIDSAFLRLVDGQGMTPRHESWENILTQIPDEDGEPQNSRVWRFGELETGRYPNQADATLELPPVDLSSSRWATLSISHNYDLEPGYDGARVEARLDGEDEWIPLRPQGGYPSTVVAENPLNADNDPTVETSAFTGDSFSRNPLTGGWVIDEFDLSQLPGFTTPILLERFSQEGFDGGPHIGSPNVQRPDDGSLTYHPDWRMPQTECGGQLETCWSRDNLNWQNPAPSEPDGRFFWSGSEGTTSDGAWGVNDWRQPGTQLTLTLNDLPDLEDQTVRLRYSYWKDVAGRVIVEPDFVPAALFPMHEADTSGGWAHATITIPAGDLTEADVFQVNFLYEAEICTWVHDWNGFSGGCRIPVDRHNRGAAIDNVVLEVLSQQAGGTVVDESVVLLKNGQSGHEVGLETSLFARGRDSLVRGLPLDHEDNGFCTRTSGNNFGGSLCEQVNGVWRSIETWGWQPRERIPPTPEAWGIDEQRTRQGEEGLVWRFGTEFDPIDNPGMTTYPGNAHERLITPRVDLQGIAGESASLTYWERYDLMRHDLLHPPDTHFLDLAMERLEDRCGSAICYDERSVYIQTVEPTPDGGERLSEWENLVDVELVYSDDKADPENGRFVFDDYRVTRSDPRGKGCTDEVPAWCPVEVDISDYIGQQVRFAFDIRTNRLDLELGTTDDEHIYGTSDRFRWTYANDDDRGDPPEVMTGGRGSNAWGDVFGWSWMIDEIGVEAESLVGNPLHLRLRAATDASINDGHWMVENVQLVGLAYEDNVAILPDGPIQDLQLDAEETFTLSGVVRNVGPDPQRNLFLTMSVDAPGLDEDDDLPEIRFLHDGADEGDEAVTGTIGPVSLGAAGDSRDRTPYEVEITLPDAERNTEFSFTLELQDEDGVLLHDDNLGDHLREFNVRIRDDDAYDDVAFTVDHPTLESVHETARFALTLENTGSTRLEGNVVVEATRLFPNESEEAIGIASPEMGELLPGRRNVIDWDWTPGEGMAGFYRINATVVPTTDHAARVLYAHVLVGDLPIYHMEDFAGNPFGDGGWMSSDDGCDGQRMDCWRVSTVFQEHGGQSLFIGNDQSGAMSYPELESSENATTPSIDLSFLARDPAEAEDGIVRGESPFKPFLSARYQPMLAASDDVTVQGRAGDSGSYATLLTGDPISGRENTMQLASFPLFHENNNVLGVGERLLTNDNTSFRFTTREWEGGDGRGFAIDLLTISSYDVEVDPPRHDVDLRLGSNKTFYFKVENTGAALDVYQIAIDPHRTADIFQSSLVTAEVLTPELELEAGESGLVEVRVEIPFQRLPDLFAGTEIAVMVTSGVDPNRAATGVIAVEDFIEEDLADLVTEMRRPRGESGPVVEGEQATFVVSVTNEGDRASRATDLAVFACPLRHEGEPVSLTTCKEEDLGTELGAETLPPLTPARDATGDSSDHGFSRTFSWVPPLDSRGEYQIVAVADPRQIVTQFDRLSSVAKIDLEVAPIERPDLTVTDLRVTDQEGNPVRQAFSGDTLRIEGTVRNEGHATATNIEARIVNQFNLRDEQIGDLNPGGSHTMSAQWVAQPGNWIVLLEASTPLVEINSDNNAQRWSLAVRSGDVQAQWEPSVLHLDPGERKEVLLTVENRRDETVDMRTVSRPGDMGLSGLPGSLQVARGASSEVPVVVTASAFAETGRHTIDMDLVQKDTGTVLASSALEVQVGAKREVRLVSDPLVTAPGTLQHPLVFSNQGSAPEAFEVVLTGPEDWSTTVLQPTIRLASGTERTVQTVIEIPAGTPAGDYELEVAAGDVLKRSLVVDVIQKPAWRSQVDAVRDLGDRTEAMVRVENVGNVGAVPPFLVEHVVEVPFTIEPTPDLLEPGEARTYRLLVASGEGHASVLLPGQDASVPVELRPQRPSVEAQRLDVQTAGRVFEGDRVEMRFGVRNFGDVAQLGLPVRMWVDGVLIAEEHVDLEAGESSDVRFRWGVEKAGPQVVSASVGGGNDSVSRAMVLNAEPREGVFAIPAPGLFGVLFLLGLVAFLANRRRRGP